jgi:hypothetical protein
MSGNVMHMADHNPFRVLGLPVRADLGDDDVRAAWRRIAAATHPDRADGGDSSRFASAAAAYALLRTSYGRGEAYADVSGVAAGTATVDSEHPVAAIHREMPHETTTVRHPEAIRRHLPLMRRLRNGRPIVLITRILIGVVICLVCVAATGWQPTTLAITVGVLTWLIRTARYDFAPS